MGKIISYLQLWMVLQHEPDMQPALEAVLPLQAFTPHEHPHLAGPGRLSSGRLLIRWRATILLETPALLGMTWGKHRNRLWVLQLWSRMQGLIQAP